MTMLRRCGMVWHAVPRAVQACVSPHRITHSLPEYHLTCCPADAVAVILRLKSQGLQAVLQGHRAAAEEWWARLGASVWWLLTSAYT